MTTITVSGTTLTEDSHILEGSNSNYGGSTNLWLENRPGVEVLRVLVRIAASSIPAGTITGFRFFMNTWSAPASGIGLAVKAYAITAANTWVEGTASGSAQAGSVCWNYAKYNTQAWAGSVGCSTSGTDYYADASPPSTVLATSGWHTWTLPTVWATNWRDSIWVNNGFIMIQDAISYFSQSFSSERAGGNII